MSMVQYFHFLRRVTLPFCCHAKLPSLAFIKPQNTQLKCTVCNSHLLILAHKEHTPCIKEMYKCSTYFLAFYKCSLCRKSNRYYSSTQSSRTFQRSARSVEGKVLLHSSWQNSLDCCLATAILLIGKTLDTEKQDSINFHLDTCSSLIALLRSLLVATLGDRLFRSLV